MSLIALVVGIITMCNGYPASGAILVIWSLCPEIQPAKAKVKTLN